MLGAFVGALQRSLRQRAKRALGLRTVDAAEIGAVTFVQRCDSSLRLNVHFHALALDGVYVRDENGALSFHRQPDPMHEEVVQVATWVYERLARVLDRHGRSLEGYDDAPSVLADEQPALASLYDASAADRQLLGEAPGQTTRKLVRAVREVLPPSEALADVGGVNVHAGAAIDGCDRKRLERPRPLHRSPSARAGAARGARRRAAALSLQAAVARRHLRRRARAARSRRATRGSRPAAAVPHAALPRLARGACEGDPAMRRFICASLCASLALGCGPDAPAEPEAPGVLEYETSSTRIYRLGRRVDVFYSGFEGEEHHACGMLSERARADLEATFAALEPAGEYGCGPEDHDRDCYPKVLIHLEGFEHSPFACDFPLSVVGEPLCEPLCCRPGLERIPSIYWMISSYFTDGFTDPFEVYGEPYVVIEPDEPCP